MYITLHKIIKLKIQEYPHKFDHWLRDIPNASVLLLWQL